MYKTPFQMYILWHKKYDEGSVLAEHLFKKINRNPDKIGIREIGIPVKFRTMHEDELSIQYDNAQKTGIVILIDDTMVIDEGWNDYVSEIISKKVGKKILLFPVAINGNSFNFHEELSMSNFIRMNDISELEKIFRVTNDLEEIEFKKQFLLNQLCHEIARELYSFKGDKFGSALKLFLSHTKCDGVDIAKRLKIYIDAFTRSKTFFDATDIEIGRNFWEKLEEEIQNAFFVLIHSDNYTNSIWCRKEILAAKQYDRPILSINAIEREEGRTFPYIGNVKSIRLTKDSSFSDYFYVITEIYLEAIRHKYNELKIDSFLEELKINNLSMSNSPELLYLHNGTITTNDDIIYPDPPLSEEELKLLNEGQRYLTPLTYFASHERILENKKISFSISEISQEQKYLKFYALKDVMCELIRYIFYFGGSIYHGGNLKYNEEGNYNLLKSMLDVLEIYRKSTNDEGIKIYNYVAYPITEHISLHDKAKYKKVLKIEEFIPDNATKNLSETRLKDFFGVKDLIHMEQWAESLTMMRKELIKKVDATVIMGGKVSGYFGRYPGILEEFLIATEMKKPIFLLGGFGGASREIINLIVGKSSDIFREDYQFENNNEHYKEFYQNNIEIQYSRICEQIKEGSYSQLNNGLSDEENGVLYDSEDAQEIISLILKGLNIVLTKNL